MLPLSEVWEIFSEQLFFAHWAFGAKIHAFVLMNNHYHLIISTPQGNIDEIMRYFATESSREISRRSGRINQTFGGPYFSCIIETYHHFLHCYKYVYRNPVEAGITKIVEAYPYSTLNGLLGSSRASIPLEPDNVLFENVGGALEWLNKPYAPSAKDDIKRALSYKRFQLPKDRVLRKPNRLEVELS